LNKIVAAAKKDGVTISISQIKEEKLGYNKPCKTEKDANLGSTMDNSELVESSGAGSRPSH
jgi:hypothetical protein